MLRVANYFSDKEYFKYVCKDQEAIDRFEEKLSCEGNHEKEVENLENQIEIIEEQSDFRGDLIEVILAECHKSNGTRKDLVRDILRLVEESSVEL